MPNPAWTPPINGWRYPIEVTQPLAHHGPLAVRCRTERGFTLYQDTPDGRWSGCVVHHPNKHVEVFGPLNFCCRVLSSALKGNK